MAGLTCGDGVADGSGSGCARLAVAGARAQVAASSAARRISPEAGRLKQEPVVNLLVIDEPYLLAAIL